MQHVNICGLMRHTSKQHTHTFAQKCTKCVLKSTQKSDNTNCLQEGELSSGGTRVRCFHGKLFDNFKILKNENNLLRKIIY